jgi:hypothetical protein
MGCLGAVGPMPSGACCIPTGSLGLGRVPLSQGVAPHSLGGIQGDAVFPRLDQACAPAAGAPPDSACPALRAARATKT